MLVGQCAGIDHAFGAGQPHFRGPTGFAGQHRDFVDHPPVRDHADARAGDAPAIRDFQEPIGDMDEG